MTNLYDVKGSSFLALREKKWFSCLRVLSVTTEASLCSASSLSIFPWSLKPHYCPFPTFAGSWKFHQPPSIVSSRRQSAGRPRRCQPLELCLKQTDDWAKRCAAIAGVQLWPVRGHCWQNDKKPAAPSAWSCLWIHQEKPGHCQGSV